MILTFLHWYSEENIFANLTLYETSSGKVDNLK